MVSKRWKLRLGVRHKQMSNKDTVLMRTFLITNGAEISRTDGCILKYKKKTNESTGASVKYQYIFAGSSQIHLQRC
jgi:hypothetical protein